MKLTKDEDKKIIQESLEVFLHIKANEYTYKESVGKCKESIMKSITLTQAKLQTKFNNNVEQLKGKALGDKLNPFDFEGKEMIVFYKKDFDEAFDLTEKYLEKK